MQAGIARFGRIILLGIVFGAILAFVGELVKPKRLDATPTRD